MYECSRCPNIFDSPKIRKDYSSLDYDIKVCPRCGSEEFFVKEEEKEEEEK